MLTNYWIGVLEPEGHIMQALEKRIPPPLVAALFALGMWASASSLPTIDINASVRTSLSGVLLLSGIFFSLAGFVSFRMAKTTVNPLKPETASSLVNSGIYRITRNPMYLGIALFLLAWAVYLSSPWTVIGAVGFVLYMNRFQIIPEEHALEKLFGADFSNYRLMVRRWL